MQKVKWQRSSVFNFSFKPKFALNLALNFSLKLKFLRKVQSLIVCETFHTDGHNLRLFNSIVMYVILILLQYVVILLLEPFSSSCRTK